MTDLPPTEGAGTGEEVVPTPVPQINYKEECMDLEDAIKSCVLEEFPLYFEGVTNSFQSLKEHKLVPEQHELYFKTISLPKIVLYILTRCDFHGIKDLQSQINRFLQEVLEYCIENLNSDLREIYTTLNRILTPSMGYYIIPQEKRKDQETYAQAKQRCCPEEQDEIKYAQFRKTDPPLSMLFYLNINFFGNHKGFSSLLDRVKVTDPRNLILLKNILSPITICQDYLLKEFIEGFAPTMTSTVIEILLAENSGPLVKNERNLTGAIMASLKMLYEKATSAEEALRMVDNFKMEFGDKGFSSTNLERSLRSLKVITSLAERAMIKEEDKEGNFKSFMRKAVIVDPKGNEEEKIIPFDPEVFKQWLQESQFVEKVLDPKAHPETIKQGIAIFHFLAIHDILTNEHIDKIWNMQVGKHESVKSTIFDSLVLLQEHLSLEHLHHIHELLHTYKDTDYDYESTRFLSQCTPLGIEKNVPGAFDGLDTLYRLATAPIQSGINPNVTSTAFSDLSKIIKLNAVAPRRRHLIEAATANLTICESILPSLQIIMNLLHTYPVKKKKNPMARKELTKRSVIEDLNQSQHIIDSTLASISHIKDENRNQVSEESQGKMEGGLVATKHFLEQLQVCLDFLEFLFSESSIRLSSVQLEMLWQNFVVQHIIPDESEMFFLWLVRTLPLFDESAILSLFNGPMSQLDTISLGVTGYELYETYFLFLNEKGSTLLQSKLKKKEYILNHNVDRDIYGYEQLWHIALDGNNQEVTRKATTCLNMLHQSIPAETQKPRYLSIRENFISQCLNYLEVAISTEPPNLCHVNCCIQILKKMALDYEAKVHKQIGVGDITIPVKTDKGANFSVSMRSTDTIVTLREAIAKEYGRSVNSIRVYHNGQVLRGDRTLKEAKINGSQELLAEAMVYKKKNLNAERFAEFAQESTVRSLITQVMELQLAALGLKGSQIRELIHNTSNPISLSEESNLAVRIMAKQANFQRLFKLLNLQGDISGRAWDLLNILPPNSSMIEDIAVEGTLEKNLKVYLDPSVILKLAYSLNMISILVKQLETKKETSNAWCDKFIALQGTHTLLHTLLDLPLAYSSAHITCFLHLLRLIEFFVMYERREGENDSLPSFPKLKEVFDLILVLSLALTEGGSGDENEIVLACISFIRTLLAASPSLLPSYANWPSLSTYITLMLLESPNNQVKHGAVDELTKLCREIQSGEETASPACFLLDILLSFLPVVDKYAHSCGAFFGLLQNLVIQSKRPELDLEWAETMVLQLIEQIKKHDVKEPSNAPETKDVSLIGLFDLLRTILGPKPSLKVLAAQNGILNELFSNCLFNIPTAVHHGPDAPPKCKTKDSRYSAYRLLVELCRGVPDNFGVLVEALLKNMGDVNPRKNWQIFPGHKNKASHGYVGLENLGATCYMNSLMQQLYVMPQFRELILSVKDESEEPEDSPLYQLQYMFAYLQETLKGSYSPTSFCSSYKDYDGNPVNTRLQMDANEFFNTLFDKLEGLLAPTSRPHILKELFGGVLSNQIISQGCEHISENTEAFYTVGIEMKNKVDILSSLELFIEGEMIEEYRCDLCDKKVNALKRCCLKSLPPILLIQMKRFEFDLVTMSNRKLNDRCEFPMELNVEPFTVEGIARKEAELNVRVSQRLKETSSHFPPEHYEYQLAGVVVHTGTANGGHYYSFIKERVPLQGETCQWFEFNDSSVEKWSPEKMAKACFGGTREIQQKNFQTGQSSTVERDILNNGYILVYERKETLSLPNKEGRKEEAKGEMEDEQKMLVNQREDPSASVHILGPMKAQVKIPEELMDKIWRENREFIVEKHIFDPNYFNFMWKLINLYTAPEYLRNPKEYVKPTMQAIEVAVRFMTDIYARSKENQLFPMWSHHLCNVFESYPTGSLWFLKLLVTKPRLLKNMILVCPMEKTREAYVRMILSAMKSMRVTEHGRYLDQYDKLVSLEKPSEMDPKDVCSFTILFMEYLFNLIKDARVPRFSNSQYFHLFQLFFELGKEEKIYFAKRGFFTSILDFISGSGAFDKENKSKTKEMEKGAKKAAFLGGALNVNGAIYAFHAILKGFCPTEKQRKKWNEIPPPTVYTSEQAKEKTAGQIEETISSLLPLTEEEFESLRNEKVFLKIFKDCYNERVIHDLIAHVSWEDLPTIEFFVACCKTALTNCMMQSQVKQGLKILVAIQACHDTYYLNRLSQTIELVLEMIKETENRDVLRVYGNWVSSRRGSVKKIKEYCSKNSNRISKVLARVPPPSPPQRRK